jgi:uncharacterized protein
MTSGPILSVFFFLLFFAIVFFGKGVGLYTDWLWFSDVGYFGVFLTAIKGRLTIGSLLAGGLFLWTWANFVAARAFASSSRPILVDDWLDFPQRHRLLKRLDTLFPLVALAVAAMAGIGLSDWWDDFLLFRHATPFGEADPVFNRDIGFYALVFPFLRNLYGLGPLLFLLGGAAAVGVYALQRDIQLGEEKVHIGRPVQIHLAALAAFFFFWKAAGYQLDLYELLYSPQGVVFGATYTDLTVRMPVLRILQVLGILSGISFVFPLLRNDRRAWLAPAGLSIVWIATAILGYGVLPNLVQRFKVIPNEITLETPNIERNIEFTRRAYGLTRVTEKPFPAAGNLQTSDLAANRSTIRNVRLWDHRPLLATFSQLQEIRTYYKFTNVDNDRYWINGEYRQVMLSVRELDHRSLPSRIWINEHLTYTHGYGLVLGPVNEVTSEGLPELFIRDIPPVTDLGERRKWLEGASPETAAETGMEVTRPEIYFGEVANDYVIVNTKSKELDYPTGDQNVYTHYAGKGGVLLSSLLRKVAFALRFGTAKFLLSSDITAESRVLYHRQIVQRVRTIAPFFLYDSDPYAVLSEGRIYWILDGYTWTNRYPYSQPMRGLLNYIRNSVKVVVDAYDGTVRFYLMDEADPIAQTYRKIFPDLLKPIDEMPADLRSHLRYPQDLFEVQAAIFARYHMTNPQVFYNQEDLWTTPTEVLEGNEVPMEPYYTIMRLPGGERDEYILMQPFTPSRKSNLIAWMAARSDPPHYGELLVYRFPKDKLVYGPMQIEARIDQDSQISQQFTLWGQRGVQVLRGNLLVIPIKDSLLYIEPVYLQAERGKIPELRRVIVAYEDRIAMRRTLDEALQDIFSGWTPPPETRRPGDRDEPRVPEKKPATGEGMAIFLRAQEALRSGDWAGYGRAMKELEAFLQKLAEGRP